MNIYSAIIIIKESQYLVSRVMKHVKTQKTL